MSSNTNLGNTPVNQGYVQLIHTGETGGIDGTLRTLYDGDGTASDLQIASNKVKISTELYIGSKTITEYIQDTVGAMLVTNASHSNLSAAYDDAGDGAIDLTATGEVTLTGSQTLSNKTLTSPIIDGVTISAIQTGSESFADNDTSLMTSAAINDKIGTEVASLVDSAPSSLDTLNELAAALGDDANFSTTVTNNIATKLAKASNLSDLANAATARSNLGVDAAGTDNSTNVTLAGSLDYLTLSGQEITRNAIDLTTDVTGTLPVGNGGTGATTLTSNAVLTGNGTSAIQAESSLTFDGAALNLLTTTANRRIEIGLGATQDVTSFVDLIGDTTYTDYGGRFIRYGGANAETRIMHRGTGDLTLLAQDSAAISFRTGSTERLKITSSGDVILKDDKVLYVGDDLTNGLRLFHLASNNGNYVRSNGGALSILTATSQPIYLNTNNTNRVTIASGGAITFNNAYTFPTSDGSSGQFLKTNGSGTLSFSAADIAYTDLGTASLGLNDNNKTLIFNSSSASWTVDFPATTLFTANTNVDNRILTATGATNGVAVNGEANLTFDGSNVLTATDGSESMAYTPSNNYLTIHETGATKGSHLRLATDNSDYFITAGGGSNAFSIYDANAAANRLVVNSSGTFHFQHHVTLQPTKKLFLDGGSDTYLHENTGDSVFMHVGGLDMMRWYETSNTGYVYCPDNVRLGVGSGIDFTIRHDTTNTYITNTTGDMNFVEADAGNMNFRNVSGTSHLYIKSGGNVGIGTTSPSYKLDVNGALRNYANGSAVFRTESTASGYGAYNKLITTTNTYDLVALNGDFLIDENGVATRFIIKDSTGNVGVGTSSPGNLLTVNSTSAYQASIQYDASTRLRISVEGSGRSRLYTDNSANVGIESGGLYVQPTKKFYLDGGNDTYIIESAANTFKVYTGGDNAFTVIPNRVYVNASGANGLLINNDEGNSADSARIFLEGTSTSAIMQQGDDLSFRTGATTGSSSGTEKFKVDSGGTLTSGQVRTSNEYQVNSNGTTIRRYVGAWTSGNQTHDVVYNGYASNMGDYVYLKTSGNTTTNHGIIVAADSYIFMGRDDLLTGALDNSATAPISDVYCRIDTSGNALFDGDVVAYSTSIASDIRLKENVKDLKYGLDEVMAIRPVSFDWIKDKKQDIGVIAQEIEKVIPEVVVEVDTLNSDKQSHKTVDYAKLTSVLINALQEQNKRIDELEEKLLCQN